MHLKITKLKDFITRRPALQEMLNEVLQQKENDTSWKYGSTQRNKEL